MPHYGYRCRSCEDEFEVLQRMSDPPEAACPACGGPGTRLFYPAGILFKGSGFYKTDSRAAAPAAKPDAAKPDAPKPAADGDGAAPAKPATPAPGGATEPAAPAAPAAKGGTAAAAAPAAD